MFVVNEKELPCLPKKAQYQLGRAETKPFISWRDIVTIAITFACFILAVASILSAPVAAWLGQTNQLIAVGFFLAIMGTCSQVQLRYLSLLMEARFGSSTLQDYQALLVNDAWARHLGLLPQIVLLALFGLPLGLSAGYKTFIGGSTSLPIASTAGLFGLTAEPGKQLIGDGLSLLAGVYLPFWLNPTFPGTYGFNMYVASNTTTALLDGPMSDYVKQIQSTIAPGDSITLVARVNATVVELAPLTPEQRVSDAFWNQTFDDYGNQFTYQADIQVGGFTAMLCGLPVTWAPEWNANYSQVFTGLWNTTNNETFQSEAQRYNVSRRLCTGTWNITSNAIVLQNASELQDSFEALQTVNQTLIQANPLGIDGWFGSFLGEYDWHNWKAYFTEVGHNHTSAMGPGLVASMIWARQVSYNGYERRAFDITWIDVNHYLKTAQDIIASKIAVTLRPGVGLLAILTVHPFLIMLAMTGKCTLYSVPIGEGFGIISMLGGVREEDLALVRGSGLSGELVGKVKMHFEVEEEGEGDGGGGIQDGGGFRGRRGRVVVGLGTARHSGKIRQRVEYD